MRISFLTIGNELIDGMVIEKNSNFASNELLKIGLSLDIKITVRDIPEDILDRPILSERKKRYYHNNRRVSARRRTIKRENASQNLLIKN